MEAPTRISEILKGIDFGPWPELLRDASDPGDEDSFTASLMSLASSLAEEDLLS